jgi:hypothetical protein
MGIMDAHRFWSKVRIGGPDECWPWTGANDGRHGYGRVRRSSGRGCVAAHRMAWELTNGPIPEDTSTYHGVCVLHRCDNPPCCNPTHLYLGGPSENAQDAVDRGRLVAPHGETHWWATLNEAQVLEVRRRYAAGENQYVLAEAFGVQQPAISRIVRGERWTRSGGVRIAGRRRPARGEQSSLAKLTEAQVRQIRSRAASGETGRALAAEFGITQGAASKIIRRATWAHV